jgi:hypothetical protein
METSMRFTKPVAAALALSLAAVSFSGSAEAGRRHHRHHGGGDAFAAGVFGFAAGAIFGSLAQPRYYYPEPSYGYYGYYDPAPVYAVPPPVVYRQTPVYGYRMQPWTPEWYAYCDDRYVSFNAQTGYFFGYDGQYHFCQ